MGRVTFAAAVCAASALVAALAQAEVSKWDPRMAAESAVVDTNGVKWIDGRFLPIEGRAFDDVEHYYDRLPANVTTNVNGGVRSMKHHTSGMLFRFATDSKKLVFRWVPYSGVLAMDHMPSTGVSGIDVYRLDEAGGRWRYVRQDTRRPEGRDAGGRMEERRDVSRESAAVQRTEVVLPRNRCGRDRFRGGSA